MTEKRYERVVCVDGFTVSIQAGSFMYSIPRLDRAKAYTHVEAGFPSERDPLLLKYQDRRGAVDPTEDVYGYVPVSVIRAVIARHGGIASGEVPPGVVTPTQEQT